MGLAKQLGQALYEAWNKTQDGYEMKTTKGLAKLYKKRGKGWCISIGDQEKVLGRRASFDHAEGFLSSIGAKPK